MSKSGNEKTSISVEQVTELLKNQIVNRFFGKIEVHLSGGNIVRVVEIKNMAPHDFKQAKSV